MKTKLLLSAFFIAGMVALGVISYHQEEGKEMEYPALILVTGFVIATCWLIISLAISSRKEAKEREKLHKGINREDHCNGYRPDQDLFL